MQQSTNGLYALAIIFVKLVKKEKATPHGEANTSPIVRCRSVFFSESVPLQNFRNFGRALQEKRGDLAVLDCNPRHIR